MQIEFSSFQNGVRHQNEVTSYQDSRPPSSQHHSLQKKVKNRKQTAATNYLATLITYVHFLFHSQESRKSKSRSSSRSKSALRKRVSFDETPVEISREPSVVPNGKLVDLDEPITNVVPNGIHLNHKEPPASAMPPPQPPLAAMLASKPSYKYVHQQPPYDNEAGDEDDEIEEDQLPELQEDDLFSTYESLKAHASISPSPPPLFWTDLSKDEIKKVAGKSKSPSGKEIQKILSNHFSIFFLQPNNPDFVFKAQAKGKCPYIIMIISLPSIQYQYQSISKHHQHLYQKMPVATMRSLLTN